MTRILLSIGLGSLICVNFVFGQRLSDEIKVRRGSFVALELNNRLTHFLPLGGAGRSFFVTYDEENNLLDIAAQWSSPTILPMRRSARADLEYIVGYLNKIQFKYRYRIHQKFSGGQTLVYFNGEYSVEDWR